MQRHSTYKYILEKKNRQYTSQIQRTITHSQSIAIPSTQEVDHAPQKAGSAQEQLFVSVVPYFYGFEPNEVTKYVRNGCLQITHSTKC